MCVCEQGRFPQRRIHGGGSFKISSPKLSQTHCVFFSQPLFASFPCSLFFFISVLLLYSHCAFTAHSSKSLFSHFQGYSCLFFSGFPQVSFHFLLGFFLSFTTTVQYFLYCPVMSSNFPCSLLSVLPTFSCHLYSLTFFVYHCHI